jgi:serine/threonine protein kinase
MRERYQDRYELRARIGKGGMGDVWSAFDHSLGREVCIKRLSTELTPRAIKELTEEARLLARVRHANVVSLLDLTHDERGTPALVMELIDGADLKTLCAALPAQGEHPGFLPDRVAVHCACAILAALAATQRAVPGLVHRDVTPHNVLVSKEGEVKLADFGIALASGRERLSAPLTVRGKLGYMAPEQARGEALDPRADLFAVGVVLYELLVRTRPWGRVRGMSELRRIERGQMTGIETLRPIERALSHALDKLLAHDREKRFVSAESALRALAPFGSSDLEMLRLANISRTMEYKIPLHPANGAQSAKSGPQLARATRTKSKIATVVERRIRGA